jgi:uncharacterized protein (DUF934 family)
MMVSWVKQGRHYRSTTQEVAVSVALDDGMHTLLQYILGMKALYWISLSL